MCSAVELLSWSLFQYEGNDPLHQICDLGAAMIVLFWKQANDLKTVFVFIICIHTIYLFISDFDHVAG